MKLGAIKRQLKRRLLKFSNPSEERLFTKYETNEAVLTNREHAKMAADWLLLSQTPSGGYSRAYYVDRKTWDLPYIETTGYIIPTLIEFSKWSGESRYRDSALKAGQFLLSVQKPTGAFCDIDHGQELAFDTGQCLLGLNYLAFVEADTNYVEAARRAGQWLTDQMNPDGSWSKVSYLGRPHTYYSRVGAALIELGTFSKNQAFVDAGMKNIRWVIGQQRPNGFFNLSQFHAGVDPVLHTIVYVLEGLLHAYKLTQDQTIFASLKKGTDALKEINLKRDLILFSQYDNEWQVTNHEKCITGIAQWAGICFEMFNITQDKDYYRLGVRSSYYLRSKQLQEGKNTSGAFPGSLPLEGYYSPFSCVNWANKFFLDAALLYAKQELPLEIEHEYWTADCFSFLEIAMPSDIPETGRLNIRAISKILDSYTSPSNLRVVDLGCGNGKYIEELRRQYPGLSAMGVDPYFGGKVPGVTLGSCANLNTPENSVDLLYAFEVFQHVKYIDATLERVKSVLRPDGHLLIVDRNPHSALGVLKKYYEKKNKWMYPADSPFFEKWYSSEEWKKLLEKNGFSVKSIDSYWHPKGRPYFHRYWIIHATTRR